jgi:hypothetical protein
VPSLVEDPHLAFQVAEAIPPQTLGDPMSTGLMQQSFGNRLTEHVFGRYGKVGH